MENTKPFRRESLGGQLSGFTPSHVLEQRIQMEVGSNPSNTSDSNTVQPDATDSLPAATPAVSMPMPPRMADQVTTSPRSQQQAPRAKARLEFRPEGNAVPGNGFIMEFPVNDYEVADLMITLDLPSDFTFVPGGKMDLVLTLGASSYEVTFLGGVFRLPRKGINGITFVRKA